MRTRRASASSGIIEQRLGFSREAPILAAIAAILIWVLGSFGQELYMAHQVGADLHEVRRQNAALEAAIHGYRAEITAAASGATVEEDARRDGYVRAGERVLLVTSPPPARPPPDRRGA